MNQEMLYQSLVQEYLLELYKLHGQMPSSMESQLLEIYTQVKLEERTSQRIIKVSEKKLTMQTRSMKKLTQHQPMIAKV